MYKKILYLTLCALITLTTACTAVQPATQEQDANAKSFAVEQGKAHIYIYRNETANFNTTMSVDIDGEHAGDTEQRTFIVKTVEPGMHSITAHAENTSNIELFAESGKNYFVWLEVYLGVVIPRAKLHNVSEEVGRAGVTESILVE
ncbi:MAG: DUF2846 domain-containing protein [Psychromonas sp.]